MKQPAQEGTRPTLMEQIWPFSLKYLEGQDLSMRSCAKRSSSQEPLPKARRRSNLPCWETSFSRIMSRRSPLLRLMGLTSTQFLFWTTSSSLKRSRTSLRLATRSAASFCPISSQLELTIHVMELCLMRILVPSVLDWYCSMIFFTSRKQDESNVNSCFHFESSLNRNPFSANSFTFAMFLKWMSRSCDSPLQITYTWFSTDSLLIACMISSYGRITKCCWYWFVWFVIGLQSMQYPASSDMHVSQSRIIIRLLLLLNVFSSLPGSMFQFILIIQYRIVQDIWGCKRSSASGRSSRLG